jgi:hypothetical protein
MADVNMSFVVTPEVAERLQSAARADGVTPSRATSLAVILGAFLPAHTRRLLRFIVEEGGDEAVRDLQERVTRAISVVGNSVLERQLLERARERGARPAETTEDEDAADSVELIRQALRDGAEARLKDKWSRGPRR